MTSTQAVSSPAEPEVQAPDFPRLLGDLGSSTAGHTLLCVAGLHGNEPAGVRALERVFQTLAKQPESLSGRFVGLVGNRAALVAGRRFLVEDLNRAWFPDRVRELGEKDRINPLEAETAELVELAREIHRVIGETEDTQSIFCLDLHTTSGPGPTFSVLNDTLPNRRFARAFPVPMVLGLEEELSGTLANYVADLGVRMVGFESGQHRDPASVDRAEAAIWISLGLTGVLDREKQPEISAAWKRLSAESAALPKVVEIRYRHPAEYGTGFRMHQGFANFRSVTAGLELGHDHDGPVKAPHGGLLLMPRYQKLGGDGFFIVRKVRPAWLEVSTAARRMRLERILHWFPGVNRHPELAGAFVVKRKTARWLALQLFHLLGFRRLESTQTQLVLARRLYDT